jgi:hypothetical protein
MYAAIYYTEDDNAELVPVQVVGPFDTEAEALKEKGKARKQCLCVKVVPYEKPTN